MRYVSSYTIFVKIFLEQENKHFQTFYKIQMYQAIFFAQLIFNLKVKNKRKNHLFSRWDYKYLIGFLIFYRF